MPLRNFFVLSLYLLCFSFLLPARAFALDPLPTYLQALACESLKTVAGQLCVIHVESGLDEWFLFPEQVSEAIRLDNMPQAMANTGDFKISPSEKWLAIDSAGEGVSCLDVIVLADALVNKATAALRHINAFPGFVQLERWEGDHLIFETNRDLNQPAESVMLMATAKRFVLHVPSGEIRPFLKSHTLKK